VELKNTKRWSANDGLSIVKNIKTGTGQIGKNSNVNIIIMKFKKTKIDLKKFRKLTEKKIRELEREEEELKKGVGRVLENLCKYQ